MGFMLIPKMILSPQDVWPELEERCVGLLDTIIYMVLPLSILPPVVLYKVGMHFGDAIVPGWSHKPWLLIAIVLLAGEVATFAAMGWLIKSIAGSVNARIDYHDAYLVAAIAPIPMWLSALFLVVPDLVLNTLAVLTGLGVSCALMYHGVYAMCHLEDHVEAAGITHVVMAAGMIAWALLLVPLLLG